MEEFRNIQGYTNIPDRYFQGHIVLKREHTHKLDLYAHKEIIYRYEILRKRYPLAKFHLDLSYTNIQDLTSVKNVYSIDLSCSSITNDSLKEIEKVVELYIAYTGVSDVSSLTKVEKLDIQGTGITDISDLRNTKIKTLAFTDIKNTVDGNYDSGITMDEWYYKYRKYPTCIR